MYAFFFFKAQPGIEPGHPRTFYPEDIIRNTIGHLDSTIYVVNEVLFIYHSLLTLLIYAICKIYNMHIRYLQYILHISRPAKSHASGVRHTHLTVMSRSHAYLCQISRLFLILTHCHTHSSLPSRQISHTG